MFFAWLHDSSQEVPTTDKWKTLGNSLEETHPAENALAHAQQLPGDPAGSVCP